MNELHDENDEEATKQPPQTSPRYHRAVLLLGGLLVLEYTRNVGQASHPLATSAAERKSNNGDSRYPRYLKKYGSGGKGSIRAAGAPLPVTGAGDLDANDGKTSSAAAALAQRLSTFRHHEPNGDRIVLPDPYRHLADLQPLPSATGEGEEEDGRPGSGGAKGPVPFYWHIFRSGGQTMKSIMGQCLGLTLAAEVGGNNVGGEETTDDPPSHQNIRTIRAQGGEAMYLDVDAATVEGLRRAAELGLVSRHTPHVVASPLLYEASDMLFGPPADQANNANGGPQQQQQQQQGQVFAMIRHPIERALSAFYYHRKAGTYGPAGAVIDIDDWIQTDDAETNYLIRTIVHKPTGEVNRADLAVAKEVLRRKVLIGLLDDKQVSLNRFKTYFGWTKLRPHQPHRDATECETKLLEYGWINTNRHPSVEEDGEAYALLVEKNLLDLELYEYAKFLFEEQGRELGFAN